jgi:hypothetical protein
MATQTIVKFLNTEGTVTLNGDYAVDALRTKFASAFSWISNAEAEVTEEGTTKVVTFKERTADKGL